MAENTELKLTKKQNEKLFKLATELKITPADLADKLAVAITNREISIGQALDEVQKAIDDPGRQMPWYEDLKDPAADDGEGTKEEEGQLIVDYDGPVPLLEDLAKELNISVDYLREAIQGKPIGNELSLEDAEDMDAATLLGLIAQMQTAHEELKADFDHLLTWAHRRGYRKE